MKVLVIEEEIRPTCSGNRRFWYASDALVEARIRCGDEGSGETDAGSVE